MKRRPGRPHEPTKLDMILDACNHVLDVAETYESKATRKDFRRLRDALEDAALEFSDRVRDRKARQARERWKAGREAS